MANGGKNWVVDISDQLKGVNPSTELEVWKKQSIYRVPACIKDLNSKAYRPQLVSFGPYHHGEADLLPMEEHKQRALLHFLNRAKKPLEDFVRVMGETVGLLQDAYQGLGEEWREEDKFLQLMILDGCFMLEVIRVATGRASDYAINDPIFSSHGMLYTVPYIKRDMLMLENQLPLLVLEKLECIENCIPKNDYHINKLVIKFLTPNPRPLPADHGLGLHPLDLFRKSLLQGPTHEAGQHRSPSASEEEANDIVRSAVELYEAGIRFKRSRTKSFRDISFRGGVLSLPAVVVDDATEFMFLNLMAFERLHVGAGNEVTSYVFFMDNIIDSAKDVSLLNASGIIQNAVGSDKAAAKIFNSLSKDVVLEAEAGLEEVQRRVNAYCRKRWNQWRANLIHTYFRNPWAFMSLAAAIVLLGLTVAQTFYTVWPYYRPNNSS